MNPPDETPAALRQLQEQLRQQLHELLTDEADCAGAERALSILPRPVTRPSWRPPLAAVAATLLVSVLAVAALLVARPARGEPVSPYRTGVTLTATRLVPTQLASAAPSASPPS